MHDIQRHILKLLTLRETARYADLKPSQIEGNKFAYHLGSLQKEGLIKNSGKTYKLTASGKRFAERVSLETFRERIQPKIVTLVAVKNPLGAYLLYKRKRTPFMGLIGLPYGKIHLGERIQEAAERELFEKTNLKAHLTHRGNVYLAIYDEEELITHMFCHIFSGEKSTGIVRTDSPIGECFWEKPNAIPFAEQMPGLKQIIRLLETKKEAFFAEYSLDTRENGV